MHVEFDGPVRAGAIHNKFKKQGMPILGASSSSIDTASSKLKKLVTFPKDLHVMDGHKLSSAILSGAIKETENSPSLSVSVKKEALRLLQGALEARRSGAVHSSNTSMDAPK